MTESHWQYPARVKSNAWRFEITPYAKPRHASGSPEFNPGRPLAVDSSELPPRSDLSSLNIVRFPSGDFTIDLRSLEASSFKTDNETS